MRKKRKRNSKQTSQSEVQTATCITQAHVSSIRAQIRTGTRIQEFKPIARSEIESYSGEARVQLLPHGADNKALEPAPGTSSTSASAATRGSIAAGSAATGDIGSEGTNRNIK